MEAIRWLKVDKQGQHNKNSIDEVELRTDPNGFDRFQNSTVWFDMQNLIEDRIEYLENQLLRSDTTEELRAKKNQMIAWKEMLGMPAYLKQCAHAEQVAYQQELELEEN